jgi:SPP1 family predicted phage head-tail adaptor
MQTGQLDQRIVILRPNVTGVDARGADVLGTPTTVGTFWANVQYLKGRELEAAQQRWAEVQYQITIRRQPSTTILSTDYATWNGQALDIRAPEGAGTREPFWTIFAKDQVA